LRLEEASLRDPERIDVMARKLGLQSPQPGQVMRMDSAGDAAPVMASVTPVAVVSAVEQFSVPSVSGLSSSHGNVPPLRIEAALGTAESF
jgi:hypothetical protein